MDNKNKVLLDDISVDLNELDTIWEAALGEIEIHVSKPNFNTWFKNTKFLEKKESTACIGLPNHFAKEWIENKYAKVVLGALRSLEENITRVEFIVCNGKNNFGIKKSIKKSPFISQAEFPEFRVDVTTNLNPKYTLDSYIIGSSNELAFAAASAVIDDVGTKYNPLFIYGGVGLGKTHLLQAVGNAVKSKYEGKIRVKYVSSEKFTNDVIWAIRNRRMETIKEKYRMVDLLIIDDIQFIIGKAATEEEFFHTFNALFENNKQIIISSDKPPKFMPNLAERLRSRFEGGMIADIGYPDYELRMAIIKSKAMEKNLSLGEDALVYLASKIQRSFREIEGALNRLAFIQKTKKLEIDIVVVTQVISELIQEPSKNISPHVVIKTVAEVFEISIEDLVSKSRKKELVNPRQIAMYLLRDVLDMSYPNIGDKIGKRDHTTALYAYEKIANEINKNQSLNQKVIIIKELISKV